MGTTQSRIMVRLKIECFSLESWVDLNRNLESHFESWVDLNQIPESHFESWVDLNQILESRFEPWVDLNLIPPSLFESWVYLNQIPQSHFESMLSQIRNFRHWVESYGKKWIVPMSDTIKSNGTNFESHLDFRWPHHKISDSRGSLK